MSQFTPSTPGQGLFRPEAQLEGAVHHGQASGPLRGRLRHRGALQRVAWDESLALRQAKVWRREGEQVQAAQALQQLGTGAKVKGKGKQ